MSSFKRRLILATLQEMRGNRTHAARALGLQRTYLLRLIRELQVPAPPPPERRRRLSGGMTGVPGEVGPGPEGAAGPASRGSKAPAGPPERPSSALAGRAPAGPRETPGANARGHAQPGAGTIAARHHPGPRPRPAGGGTASRRQRGAPAPRPAPAATLRAHRPAGERERRPARVPQRSTRGR